MNINHSLLSQITEKVVNINGKKFFLLRYLWLLVFFPVTTSSRGSFDRGNNNNPSIWTYNLSALLDDITFRICFLKTKHIINIKIKKIAVIVTSPTKTDQSGQIKANMRQCHKG